MVTVVVMTAAAAAAGSVTSDAKYRHTQASG